MNRPKLLRSRSDGRFFKFQLRCMRGLRTRLQRLHQSWSNDSEVLDSKREEMARHYDQLAASTIGSQEQQMHHSMESWDSELDRAIGFAERELLLSVRSEKEKTESLKQGFLQNKLSLKKKRDDDIAITHKALEDHRLKAAQSRDGVRNKLENERRNLSASRADLDEWLLLKTGRILKSIDENLPDEIVHEIQAVGELQRVAKSVEEQKRILAELTQSIQKFTQTRWYSSPWFLLVGPALSSLIGVVLWQVGIAIVFAVLVALVGSLVLTAILYYAARPVLGKSVQRFAFDFSMASKKWVAWLEHAGSIAEKQYQAELQLAASNHAQSLERISSNYKLDKEELHKKLHSDLENLRVSSIRRRWELTQGRQSSFQNLNAKWTPKIEQLREEFASQNSKLKADREGDLQNLNNQFLASQLRCSERWLDGASQTQSANLALHRFFEETQPKWSSTVYRSGGWNRDAQNLVWRLGESSVQLEPSQEAASFNAKLRMDGMPWPVAFDLLSHGALILHNSQELDTTTEGLVQNVILRSITSLPAGAMKVTLIDPQGLGKKYSWLMSLADIDPSLVGDRVWTQPLHIADQLSNVARGCEDIIQQSLRNNHANLYEYNQSAGPMAIPYRLLVWDQFPFGMDDNAWQSLCSILAAGGRCGVGVILRISPTHIWPTFADAKKLSEFGLHLHFPPTWPQQSARWGAPELDHAPIQLVEPPTEDQIRAVMVHHIEAISQLGRIIVPFDSILPAAEETQSASSADNLTIPLGIAASGRPQQMKLGYGTAQHVLIAGKTGSGKSSLLHTMITSAAIKYSPDQLRLVLLDFKKGVEFQVYSESEIPHADVIGIESKREFGVSTLEYVDRIMHARGEAFRQWGVQDIPSLNRKNPEVSMPRILIVIDEFQELFVEDDKLSQQASMLMDRIVRQGRSFGIHLVLASQTLGGAYSLPRTTLAQMAVRIALQCDSSDAMLILGEDNTAAERLRHSGQAIYNDGGGRIESNQGFQVAYIDKETQLQHLQTIPAAPPPWEPTINPMGRRVVFEGHKPAVWDPATMDRFFSEAKQTGEYSFACVLGDSVSIDPPIVKWVQRNAGRNLCVVGPDERMAASLLAGTLQGFIASCPDALDENNASVGAYPVTVLNGVRAEDSELSKVVSTLEKTRGLKMVSPRDVEAAIGQWKAELDRRMASPQQKFPTQLLCILNLARFRELRKGDEFAFGDSGASTQPDAILSEVLREGPALGLHVWVWADSAGTLARWLSRQSMRDFELRVLMQMSASDSNQLIDSNQANKLEPHVAIYQDEMDGKPIKFRPFASETLPMIQPQERLN